MIWIPAILLFIVAAYFVHAGFKYTRMISNIFLSLVYRPVFENVPSGRGERVTILDSSDHEIEILLLERKGSKNVLIFSHESGAGKEFWERYAYFVPDLGVTLLSVDLWPDAGQEGPSNALSQWPTAERVERLVTVIRWAKKAYAPDAKIALFGVSNGADLALAASFREPAVLAVIADGLFSMKEIFRDYIRRWAPILVKPNFFGQTFPEPIVNIFTNLGFWYSQRKSGKRFVDVERLLKTKHVPLLMIHGAEDDYVPSTHQEFLEKTNGPGAVRRLVVPEAGHNEGVVRGRESYERTISEFLIKTYADTQP